MVWFFFFFFNLETTKAAGFKKISQLPELFPPVVLCVLFLNPLLQCTCLGSAETQGLLGFYVKKKPIEFVVGFFFFSSELFQGAFNYASFFFFFFNFQPQNVRPRTL